MEYLGPEPADLANVYALNLAFIEILGGRETALAACADLPAGVALTLSTLERHRALRLARSPFLIFSLRETDEWRWQAAFDGSHREDLIDVLERPSREEVRLVSATLAFLWQFSKRSPYAVRVISGASLSWCEQLLDSTLLDLFRFASADADLLSFRLADNPAFWRKLLTAASSDERQVRIAARVSALQTVLTSPSERAHERLPAAACRLPMPARQVAQRAGVSKPGPHGYNTRPHESTDHQKPDEDLRER